MEICVLDILTLNCISFFQKANPAFHIPKIIPLEDWLLVLTSCTVCKDCSGICTWTTTRYTINMVGQITIMSQLPFIKQVGPMTRRCRSYLVFHMVTKRPDDIPLTLYFELFSIKIIINNNSMLYGVFMVTLTPSTGGIKGAGIFKKNLFNIFFYLDKYSTVTITTYNIYFTDYGYFTLH